jgi:hypothetical protein
MTQVHDRRHQHYRSIDFDFYRAQAVALRSQARRDAFEFYPAFRIALATLATTLAITIISSMQFTWV